MFSGRALAVHAPDRPLLFKFTTLPTLTMTTSSSLASVRAVTTSRRPPGNHGCPGVEIIPGLWTAHFHDIETTDALRAVAPPVTVVVNVGTDKCPVVSYGDGVRVVAIDLLDDPDELKAADNMPDGSDKDGVKSALLERLATGDDAGLVPCGDARKDFDAVNSLVDETLGGGGAVGTAAAAPPPDARPARPPDGGVTVAAAVGRAVGGGPPVAVAVVVVVVDRTVRHHLADVVREGGTHGFEALLLEDVPRHGRPTLRRSSTPRGEVVGVGPFALEVSAVVAVAVRVCFSFARNLVVVVSFVVSKKGPPSPASQAVGAVGDNGGGRDVRQMRGATGRWAVATPSSRGWIVAGVGKHPTLFFMTLFCGTNLHTTSIGCQNYVSELGLPLTLESMLNE